MKTNENKREEIIKKVYSEIFEKFGAALKNFKNHFEIFYQLCQTEFHNIINEMMIGKCRNIVDIAQCCALLNYLK